MEVNKEFDIEKIFYYTLISTFIILALISMYLCTISSTIRDVDNKQDSVCEILNSNNKYIPLEFNNLKDSVKKDTIQFYYLQDGTKYINFQLLK